MEIQTNYLKTEKTARYSTFGFKSEKTKYFWFCLHGSVMQCEQMLYKFADFDPHEHYIVAPEGLNRTYVKGFSGDAAASWLTKRDRLTEIPDFCNYLQSLYEMQTEGLSRECKKTILGFSQGGTSAFRWLHSKKVFVDNLIAYSCWIPEDIDLKLSKTSLEDVQLIYTYGKQDQYISEERIEALKSIINANKLEIPILSYDGNHRVDKANVANLFHEFIK